MCESNHVPSLHKIRYGSVKVGEGSCFELGIRSMLFALLRICLSEGNVERLS